MKSRTTKRFRDAFEVLPEEIKQQTRKAFGLWMTDTSHPSLKFKQIFSEERVYSVRIGIG